MSFRNLKSSALPGGNPVRHESLRPAPKLTALTLILLGGVLILGAAIGLAKEKKPPTRTVLGVVIDDAENAIQGASVELTDRQTGKVLEIYSQDGGHYQYADLRFDHDYTVKATYQGLSSEVRQASSLDTRTPLVLNLTIPKPNK
jgi:multidrug efflux pump subunit AcrA (membrane-fusion protein)